MNIKTNNRNISKIITNTFGVLGYLCCFLLWIWIIVLYFGEYKDYIFSIFINENKIAVTPINLINIPESLLIIISVVVLSLMIILTIYAFIKMPISAVQISKKIVHQSAETLTPGLIKISNKKLTKKYRIKITAELVAIIKMILIAIATLLVYIFRFTESNLINYEVVQIVGYFLSIISLALFIFQYIIAWLLKTNKRDIW